MFKYFGHQNVFVLEGGFKRYLDLKLPLETSLEPETAKVSDDYKVPELNTKMVISYNELLLKIQNYSKFNGNLIDARNSKRFQGVVPEPRPVPSGHIPSSINIPFDSLVENDGLIPKDKFVQILEENTVDLKQEVISSCGSGVTACLLLLGLDTYGLKDVSDTILYDGSWAEWASYKQSPIVCQNSL